MTMLVFAGPTLSATEIETRGPFVCLPPVTQGDLFAAARGAPEAIGIIDGYFSGAPSVWHKEILWALSHGVPVFGAGSMGALRAAELHSFGMCGVGRIFESFRDGELEDDDEVAVVHAPAELGYLAASEAMVNIRATLERAEAAEVIGGGARRALEAYAKSLFFPQRNWEAILDAAPASGVSQVERARLAQWLPQGRIDQKRLDALQMLDAMRQAAKPALPAFKFEWTVFWDELVRRTEDSSGPDATASTSRVLDELRLKGADAYGRVEARALLRKAATLGAAPGEAVSREELQAALASLRAKLGLYTRADLDRWMVENGLDAGSVERLLASQTRLERWRHHARGGLEPYLIEELRASGEYRELAGRAVRKAEALAACGAPTGASAVAMRLWFFEQRLGQSLPDDIEAAARSLGFADSAALDGALLRERLFADAIGCK